MERITSSLSFPGNSLRLCDHDIHKHFDEHIATHNHSTYDQAMLGGIDRSNIWEIFGKWTLESCLGMRRAINDSSYWTTIRWRGHSQSTLWFPKYSGLWSRSSSRNNVVDYLTFYSLFIVIRLKNISKLLRFAGDVNLMK